MKKSIYVATALVLALFARPAAADPIQFDTNGGAAGGLITADVFDWAPGNSLLIENATGTKATLLFQANLNTIQVSGTDFANGGGGFFYTAVAGFGVDIVPQGANSAQFLFDAGNPTNFFKIYVNTVPATVDGASNLTGSCFVCGLEILSGTAIANGFSSNFQITDLTPVNLDQFNGTTEGPGDNYPLVDTVTGNGSTALQVIVNSHNASYFTDLVDLSSLAFTNTSQIAPYNQVNPSAFFTNNGTTDANETGATAVGAVNGLCIGIDPCKIIAQSDANTSFGTAAVPEPATLGLFGLGLAGTAVAARRRQKKAQQQA